MHKTGMCVTLLRSGHRDVISQEVSGTACMSRTTWLRTCTYCCRHKGKGRQHWREEGASSKAEEGQEGCSY